MYLRGMKKSANGILTMLVFAFSDAVLFWGYEDRRAGKGFPDERGSCETE